MMAEAERIAAGKLTRALRDDVSYFIDEHRENIVRQAAAVNPDDSYDAASLALHDLSAEIVDYITNRFAATLASFGIPVDGPEQAGLSVEQLFSATAQRGVKVCGQCGGRGVVPS
jgi:hypothetical protein